MKTFLLGKVCICSLLCSFRENRILNWRSVKSSPSVSFARIWFPEFLRLFHCFKSKFVSLFFTKGRSEQPSYMFFPSCSIVISHVFRLSTCYPRKGATFFTNSFPCLLSSVLSPRYSHYELSSHLGLMLRECIKQRAIHERILSQPSLVDPLIRIHSRSRYFHVSCDVLSILNDLFSQNGALVSTLLNPGEPLFPYVLVCLSTDFAVLFVDAAPD